jgi:RNA polymerase-binding protein DksA
VDIIQGGKKVVNDVTQIREYLESERNRLREELQLKTGEQTSESGNAYGKKGEASLGSSEFEKGLALAQRRREQFAGIERALEKLNDGTYDMCDSCGAPIPSDRLKAIPQTNLCLDYKAKQER